MCPSDQEGAEWHILAKKNVFCSNGMFAQRLDSSGVWEHVSLIHGYRRTAVVVALTTEAAVALDASQGLGWFLRGASSHRGAPMDVAWLREGFGCCPWYRRLTREYVLRRWRSPKCSVLKKHAV